MSTTANTIALFGKEYPFRFGIKFQREFMNHYKLKKINDFQNKLALIDKGELESLDVLGVVVLSAIRAASKKPITIDPDDIIDYINLKGEDVLKPLMEAMQQAQPEAEESPNAVGKSNKAG